MNTIFNTLSTWLDKNLSSNTQLIVAYSGGRDSHVLLDALAKLKASYAYHLSAIHINHGLQQISDSWVGHCQQVCAGYAVPLETIHLALKIHPGESLEEKARTARYAAFAKHMNANSILLTAHTQDDQAETFLLQMMRGSGLKGLASIAPSKSFATGALARPLLEVSRDEIAHYAAQHNLSWIEDPSNDNVALRRNFMRKHILGPLDSVQPHSSRCIARSAQHCQSALLLLEDYLAADLALCQAQEPHTLHVDVLKQFSAEKQNYIVGLWLSRLHIILPPTTKRQEMLRQLLTAALDSNPVIVFGQWQLRRYQNLIYVLPLGQDREAKGQWEWDLQAPFTMPDGTTWQVKRVQGKGASLGKLQNTKLSICYRQGGERITLDKQSNSKSLKKLLQEIKMPPWQRQSLPLFYRDTSLIAVADLFISKEWQVTHPEEEGLCFEKVES